MNIDKSIDWLIDAYQNRQAIGKDTPACQAMIDSLKSPSRMKELIANSEGESFDPLTPKELGDLLILGPIGAGGMGEVFQARHKKLNRIQALKLLPSHRLTSNIALQRFEREMQAIGQLNHPNIVTVYDAGVAEETPFITMELIDGISIHQLVREKQDSKSQVSIDAALSYLVDAAKGIEHAHQNKVLHRDIKPSNLMIDKHGLVKVLDLGLAKFVGEHVSIDVNTKSEADDSEPLTADFEILGTPDFMAPEQFRGNADERSDVYALAATLQFLLTGKTLFPEARGLIQKSLAICNDQIPSVEKFRSDVPKQLQEIIARGLQKNPNDRQQSAREFRSSLEAVIARVELENGKVNFESKTLNAKAGTRNNFIQRGIFLSACCALILVGAFFAYSFFQGQNNASPTPKSTELPFEIEYLSRKYPDLPNDDPAQIHIREGIIGKDVFLANHMDFVKVELKLSQPKYFYLVALNPTEDPSYKIQLCLPSGPTVIPQAKTEATFPSDELSLYQLSDGTGQVAFILLVADEPLPAFQEWKEQNLKEFPWQISRAPSVWKYSKPTNIERLIQNRTDDRAPAQIVSTRNAVVESCTHFLAKVEGVESYWLSFPVTKQTMTD